MKLNNFYVRKIMFLFQSFCEILNLFSEKITYFETSHMLQISMVSCVGNQKGVPFDFFKKMCIWETLGIDLYWYSKAIPNVSQIHFFFTPIWIC